MKKKNSARPGQLAGLGRRLLRGAVLCTAIGALVSGGCKAPAAAEPSEDREINVIESGDSYDWQYTRAFAGEPDAGMEIDGVLSEDVWQEKNWLEHVEKGVKVRYTTAFTETGLYIAAVAEDERMQWNDTRAFMNNSSFRFYIVSNTAEDYFCFDCLNFYVDEKDSSCRQQTRFEAEAVRSVNEEGVPTLTAEFFATWEDLNYTVNPETGMPDFARIVPMYRYVEGFESADNTFLKPAFAEVDNNRVNNALLFDETGYINVGSENAELGNAANGFAKSDGWDLSDLDGGEDGIKTVHTTAEHGQAIFFTGIESSRYAYTVDMKLTGGIRDTAPSAGVCDMKSAAEFNCMRIAGSAYLDSGKKALTYNTLDFYETLWHDVLRGDRLEETASDIIKIRVIKDDTRYYYIINESYAFSLDLDWLGGDTCPGLYSLGAEVEFSGWEATDYVGAEQDEAFQTLTDTYMHVVKVSDRISGGTLSLDKLAVPKNSGETVNLTVNPANGYILTDLLINGRSVYEELVPTMKNGVIELRPTESMLIDAVFTPLPAESCIRITGLTARTNGAAVIGLPYTLTSSDEKLANLLFWHDATTSSGMFDISCLRAGEYEIGGRSFKTDGIYTLAFEGVFPKGEQHVFTIDTNEEIFAGLSYYDWGTITLNPIKARNMAEDEDGNVRTTNTSYTDEYSYFVYNEPVEGSFRLDMTVKAQNDKWPCYGFTLEDEYNNSVQFFAAGVSTYRIMGNYDGWYTQSDKGHTFVENESRLALIYDEVSEQFYFYVNDVLFDCVKRSDYLQGTSFNYGIVGYMSGADGSFRRVTEEDPLAVFTKPAVMTEFTVTAPKEATLTLDGKKTDGKDVPVMSEITVSIPVQDKRQYVIYLDGKPLETTHKNGKITAVFTVTGCHRVEYDIAYITEWIHEPFEYDSASGGYRVNDHTKTANGGYLAGARVAAGASFLLEADIRDMDTSQWPSAGLIVGTGKDRYVRFSVIRDTDASPNRYALRVGNADGKEIVKWFFDIETLADNKPFGARDSGTMKLSLAYEDGYYYVFINGVLSMAFDENELLSGEISIRDSLGNGAWKMGLFAERKAVFTGWKFSRNPGSYLEDFPKMEWIHRPLLYDRETGYFRVLDHSSLANGGYLGGALFTQGSSFMVETAVRDMDPELWPSVGLLAGTDASHYVRFSVVRNTDVAPNVYGLRAGNADGKEIVRWFADIDTLWDNQPFGADGDGEMKLALVYEGGIYYVFVNGRMATAFNENELLSGEISIKDSLGTGFVKPGLFAERRVTFVSWGYSGDVSGYLGNMPRLEWIHSPFMYDFGNGHFRVADHNSLANGGYFRDLSRRPGESFLVETTVRDMDTAHWPSVGVLAGTDAGHYVRFSVVRNTEANPNVYGLRVGNAAGKEIVKWFASLEPLADNKPFGADGNGEMKLAVAYEDGYYYVFVNGTLAAAFDENEKLSGEISIKDSLGTGNVKLGLFAERRITFTGWQYSADPASYLGNMPAMEWVHTPLVYDFATGQYVNDHESAASGGYFGDFAQKPGGSMMIETTVRDMDTETWPSVGVLAGTDESHYVRFSVIRNTDAAGSRSRTARSAADPYAYLLRVGNADGEQIVRPFADIPALRDMAPYGADMQGSMKLCLVYHEGTYYVYVNDVLASAFKEDSVLTKEENGVVTGRKTIVQSLGSGDVGLGLFAERRITFVSWSYTANEAEILEKLGQKAETGTVTVRLTGADSNATVVIRDESGSIVHSAAGGFTTKLSAGTYTVDVESGTAVAKTERITVSKDAQSSVTVRTLAKLAAAGYTIDGGTWTADTELPTFEPASGIYRANWSKFNTGVLAQPAAVSASEDWVLEADVQVLSDASYPSIGLALYNGSNFGQNVKFEIVRATADGVAAADHEWLLRVNGVNYVRGDAGPGAVHSDWVRDHQADLAGKVHLAVVHADGGYYMFLNGTRVCEITGTAAANLTAGWGSIRPGVYGEQEGTFENWSYGTDLSAYEAQLPQKGSLTVAVTGVDTGAAIVVKDGSGAEVYRAAGGFTASLPVGSYSVETESATAVARTESVTLSANAQSSVTVRTMVKLEAAGYTIDGGTWTADAELPTFEPASGIYRANWSKFNTGVLAQPAAVSASEDWVLEADVQVLSDASYPSIGLALYNGSNFGQNVKFEIVRATADGVAAADHEWLLRVNGVNYVRGDAGPGAVHSDWVRDHQADLTGKVHLAVVHADGGYYMFLNGTRVCEITGTAANLTAGWGSIRPGVYGEQEGTFENWSYGTDLSAYESQLPQKGSLTVAVTGVDTGATIVVKDGSGAEVYRAAGGFTASLPVGSYSVETESATAVARTESVTLSAGAQSSVTVKTMVKLEDAIYTNQWGGPTAGVVFEPATGIYRGAYGWLNTSVLVQPTSVGASENWVLEADVEALSDAQYPSVGFALYNGDNFADNVKFEIVRTTPVAGDPSTNVWQLRVNGRDYTGYDQNLLNKKVHLALVHVNGGYHMFVDGTEVCALTDQEATDLTNRLNGWGSIRLGFYAEQEATFENWSYGTDVSAYAGKIRTMEWIHTPLVYNFAARQYTNDHDTTASGGYFTDFSAAQGSAFTVETTVRDMSTTTWPSVGLIVGSDTGNWVRFSVLRNTDANPNVYLLRVGGSAGGEIVNGLSDNTPFGADGTGDMKLRVMYENGSFSVYINDALAMSFSENEQLNNGMTILDAMGTGDRRVGLFAERQITFVNWNYAAQ